MAQAEGRGNNLLEALSNTQLPAHRPTEPAVRGDERQSTETSEVNDRPSGSRRPALTRDDFIEERRPAPRQEETDGKKPAPRKLKWKGEELTVHDLVEKPGLIEAIIQSAEQLPALTRKHQELLDGLAKKHLEEKPEPQKQTQTQPPAPAPKALTPEDIVRAYSGMALQLAETGWIEEELPAAYPKLIANLAWRADQIDLITDRFNQMVNTVNQLWNWANEKEAQRKEFLEKTNLNATIDGAIEEVAGRPGKIYKSLSTPQVRQDFKAWLIGDVNPEQAKISPEFIADMWFAFNADAVREFAAAEEEDPPPVRRRASGDGQSAQRGGPPEPAKKKSVLDRLTDSKLGSQE